MINNKESFSNDMIMGKVNEDYVYKLIRKYWPEREIQKSNDLYSNYDFLDDKYKYELKSRRFEYNKYETTMIPEMKCHKKTYLLFLFTDGLYYIRYRKSVFKCFEKKLFVKNRCDKDDVKKLYYYIPIEMLKKVDVDNKNKKIEPEKFYVNLN